MSAYELAAADNSVLIITDVQQKLFAVMPDKEKLLDSFQKLLKGCAVLGVPALATEQNPRGLGPTLAEVSSLIPDFSPVPKMSFSILAEKAFAAKLRASRRDNIFLTGIEAHICVYQSCLELLLAGYTVYVVADCVSSRTAANRDLALREMAAAGARLTSVEMLFFELLRTASSANFKAVSSIIK
jgi:nicotinamidase-related amidase